MGMKGTKYDVNVVILYGVEPNLKKKEYAKRVIQSFDNLDDAIDKLVEISIQCDELFDYCSADIRNDIWNYQKDFDDGKPYRIIFENLAYYGAEKGKPVMYMGPGAYSIEKRVVQ